MEKDIQNLIHGLTILNQRIKIIDKYLENNASDFKSFKEKVWDEEFKKSEQLVIGGFMLNSENALQLSLIHI